MQIKLEIEYAKSALDNLRHEVVAGPSDVVIPISTNRPTLLAMVDRPFDAEEVKATLNILSGQVSLYDKAKRVIELQDEVIATYENKLMAVQSLAKLSSDPFHIADSMLVKARNDGELDCTLCKGPRHQCEVRT